MSEPLSLKPSQYNLVHNHGRGEPTATYQLWETRDEELVHVVNLAHRYVSSGWESRYFETESGPVPRLLLVATPDGFYEIKRVLVYEKLARLS